MKNLVPYLISATILTGACTNKGKVDLPMQKEISYQTQLALHDTLEKSIVNTIDDYTKMFGREGPPPIIRDTSITEYCDGHIIHTTFAIGKPGEIIINNDPMVPKTAASVKYTIAHELPHTRHMKKYIRKNTITLSTGDIAYGTVGFNILFHTIDQGDSKFSRIEEGVAEYMASKLYPGYTTPSASYFALGYCFHALIKSGYLTHKGITKMPGENTIADLMKKLWGDEYITSESLQILMSMFERIQKVGKTPNLTPEMIMDKVDAILADYTLPAIITLQ